MDFKLFEPWSQLFVELEANVKLEFGQDDKNFIEIDVEMDLGNLYRLEIII